MKVANDQKLDNRQLREWITKGVDFLNFQKKFSGPKVGWITKRIG
jgi:hypothetical protein